MAVTSQSHRRRRTPAVARAEIIEAARRELEVTPALTVAGLMARTDMTRKTFYVHFDGLGALLLEMIRPLRRDLDAMLVAWRDAADPVAAGRAALAEAVSRYTRDSVLLTALWSAPISDASVVEARDELVRPLVEAAAAIAIRERGLPRAEAREVGRALALMNVHVLLDLGPRPTQARKRLTSNAIRDVWERTLLSDGQVSKVE